MENKVCWRGRMCLLFRFKHTQVHIYVVCGCVLLGCKTRNWDRLCLLFHCWSYKWNTLLASFSLFVASLHKLKQLCIYVAGRLCKWIVAHVVKYNFQLFFLCQLFIVATLLGCLCGECFRNPFDPHSYVNTYVSMYICIRVNKLKCMHEASYCQLLLKVMYARAKQLFLRLLLEVYCRYFQSINSLSAQTRTHIRIRPPRPMKPRHSSIRFCSFPVFKNRY